eukprot:324327-Rhodomonas_salina.2
MINKSFYRSGIQAVVTQPRVLNTRVYHDWSIAAKMKSEQHLAGYSALRGQLSYAHNRCTKLRPGPGGAEGGQH